MQAAAPVHPIETLDPADDRTVFKKTDATLPGSVMALGQGDLLLPYQARAIKALDTTNVLYIEKSRRIGLTWGLASHAALTAAASRKAGGMDVYYMGYEKDMAREFIDVCGMWLKAFNVAAADVDEFVFQEESEGEKEIKAFRITLPSGFEVVALPSKPRAFRGKQGLVIIDEAAFMDKVEETLDAAMALLQWGGSVVVVSTHYGIDNAFNTKLEEVRADKRKGEVITITFDDALADGLYERIALVSRKKLLPKEEWIADIRAKYGKAASQELDCIPMQGGLPWIDIDDYNACLHDDAGRPDLYQNGACFVGYDVARSHDGIIIWTLEEVGETLWLRERWEEVDQKFSVQYAAFDSVFARYRVYGAGVDATGMGAAVAERHQEKHGESRVEAHTLTPAHRVELATFLRDRFESGTIRIPRDSEIRKDLLALKRAGKDGKALMEGRVHPDRFWAAALACAVACGVRVEYGYQGAPRATSNDDEDDGPFSKQRAVGTTRHGMPKGGGAW